MVLWFMALKPKVYIIFYVYARARVQWCKNCYQNCTGWFFVTVHDLCAQVAHAHWICLALICYQSHQQNHTILCNFPQKRLVMSCGYTIEYIFTFTLWIRFHCTCLTQPRQCNFSFFLDKENKGQLTNWNDFLIINIIQ